MNLKHRHSGRRNEAIAAYVVCSSASDFSLKAPTLQWLQISAIVSDVSEQRGPFDG